MAENLLLVIVTSPPDHPLKAALLAALAGRFPAVDGGVEVVPPDDAGTHAVVEFTGRCGCSWRSGSCRSAVRC